MKILVINARSSSLKYQLIDMQDESVLAKGNCERIGMDVGIFGHKTFDGREKHIEDVYKRQPYISTSDRQENSLNHLVLVLTDFRNSANMKP